MLFLFNYNISSLGADSTGAKCQKFNIVGKEIDNLQLAKYIADVQNKPLKYKMVDFHSQDLDMILDMLLMEINERNGWEPHSAYKKLDEVVKWTLIMIGG